MNTEQTGTVPCVEIEDFKAESPDISFEIPKLSVPSGKFCALVGKSGAGKSVLLNILCGYLPVPWMKKQKDGAKAVQFKKFRIGGTALTPEVFNSPPKLLRNALRAEDIIYLPQKFPEDRSHFRKTHSELNDSVAAIATEVSRKIIRETLREHCKDCGLSEALSKPFKNLSGGERRRLEFNARLCGIKLKYGEKAKGGNNNNRGNSIPVLCLFDEPTSGLDPATQSQYFQDLKKDLSSFDDKGITVTVILATHAINIIRDEEFFDHVIYLEKSETTSKVSETCTRAVFIESGTFIKLTVRTSEKGTSENASPPSASIKDRLFRLFLSFTPTEVRHAGARQFSGKSKTAYFITFAIPFIVGLIIFAAFLGRRGGPDAERFIFFSTIYAFWLGIFNSCQIINGAVASGEWSAWVLAFRRSFFRFYAANTFVSCCISLGQTIIFAAVIFLLTAPSKKNLLGNVFITKSQLDSYFFSDVVGISLNVIICIFFLGSIFAACFVGSAVGACVSCMTKDVLSALKVVVGIVVASMIMSSTVLKSNGNRIPVSPPLYLRIFCGASFPSLSFWVASELEKKEKALKVEEYALKVEGHALKVEGHASKKEAHALKEEEKKALEEEAKTLEEEKKALKEEAKALEKEVNASKKEAHALKEKAYVSKKEAYALESEAHALKEKAYALEEEEKKALEEEAYALESEAHALKEKAYALKKEAYALESEAHAGFFPHLLEDFSLILPQRYFFNIGRLLHADVLEFDSTYSDEAPLKKFKYVLNTLGDTALCENWKNWQNIRNAETFEDTLADLKEQGKSLNERQFVPFILKVCVFEFAAILLLSFLFFSLGFFFLTKNNRYYEIH